MRTWTLAVSICAHAAVVVAIFVAPIFATADLPDPRRPLTFEAITPIATPAIAVTPSSPSPPPTKSIQPFPIDEPRELPVDDPPLIAVRRRRSMPVIPVESSTYLSAMDRQVTTSRPRP
jgi:hypothetical protein